jgi:hypothetical protein
MVEEAFPPLEMWAIDLDAVPTGPHFRSGPRPKLTERLTFGGPRVTAISNSYHPEDADLQAFIAGSHDRWTLAHLAVTFPSADDPPLVSAKVQVHLADDGDPPATIAFSLLPLSSGTPFEETRSYTVSPSVTAGGISISLGSVGTQKEVHGTDVFISGGGELTAAPSWAFTPTATQPLVGSSRLVMILQTPPGRIGRISVDVEAEISERPDWKLRRQRIPLVSDDPADAHAEIAF